MKYLLQFIAAAVLITLGFLAPNELRPEFIGQALIILITLVIVEIGYDIFVNRKRWILILRCKYLALLGQHIRFSMSYQYRIKINDKYLLVKNSNWDQYQHVGGKYKRLPETRYILKKFEGLDDLKLRTTGLMEDDLVVFIPAKNAIEFIDWFNTRRDREISHWREFYEELIEGKGSVLPQKLFPYVNYSFVYTVTTPLKRAHAWDCWEILQYDVLDLIPNNAQKQELIDLQELGNTDYIKWADHEHIQSLGYDKHLRETPYKISKHTKWVINLKWSEN